MTKKERIAELERKVADLEARVVPPVYGPYWNTIPPYQPPTQWWDKTVWSSSGSNAAAPSYLPTNILNIGAAS